MTDLFGSVNCHPSPPDIWLLIMLEGVFWRGFICLYLSQQKLIDDAYLLLSLIFWTLLFDSVSFKYVSGEAYPVFNAIDVNYQKMIRVKLLENVNTLHWWPFLNSPFNLLAHPFHERNKRSALITLMMFIWGNLNASWIFCSVKIDTLAWTVVYLESVYEKDASSKVLILESINVFQ